MSLSGISRVIPADLARRKQIDDFPYLAATMPPPLSRELDANDEPIGEHLTTPEEDAQRLASVDQQIFEKLQKAERDAHDIARQAYEEGFSAGEREGREFGESQYRVFGERLDSHLNELARVAGLVDKAAKDELIALTVAMAEYLAAQHLERAPGAIEAVLDTVLAANPFPSLVDPAGNTEPLVVFLNAKDLGDMGDRAYGYRGVRIAEDKDLPRGSLRLETAEGVLEATLERRKERLLELMHQFKEMEEP